MIDKEVDMTYRFLWDSEPTDEQLFFLMQEVAKDVQLKQEKTAKLVLENIAQESVRIRSVQ